MSDSRHRFGIGGIAGFLTLCGGQTVSMLGSRISSFGLGVWIYQETTSATRFALSAFFRAVPFILVSPLAGALVDRWDRRRTMILADTGAAFTMLCLAGILWGQRIELWHIYLAMGMVALFDAFQSPAFEISMGLMIPREHLARASGLIYFGAEGTRILAPPLAGMLLVIVHLYGLLVIDFVTFFFSVLVLLWIRLPKTRETPESVKHRGSLGREMVFGWHYIRQRPGLFGLLSLFAFTNFTLGIVIVLFTPLVLSFTSAAMLGLVMGFSAGGGMAGGALMAFWGGPKRKVSGILGFMVLQGSILLLGGLRPSVPLVSGAAFTFMFCAPIVAGCSQAMWLRKVPSDVQGRVFGIRRMVAVSAMPLAYLAAGPLSDFVFEPLLLPGGPLADTVGRYVGVGQGRGTGLLLIVLGVVTLTAVGIAALYRPLRNLEEELPDAPTLAVEEAS